MAAQPNDACTALTSTGGTGKVRGAGGGLRGGGGVSSLPCFPVPCFPVPLCPVPRCAFVSCVMLCCALPSDPVPCRAMLSYPVSCHACAMPCHAVPCPPTLCHVMHVPCRAMPSYPVSCHACVMPCHALLPCVMPCWLYRAGAVGHAWRLHLRYQGDKCTSSWGRGSHHHQQHQ